MTASFYKNRDTHLIAVDCIIMGFKDNDLHVLAAKRQFEPMKGGWSLMGGL